METNFAVDERPSLNKYSGADIFLIDDEQLVVDTLTYFLRSAGFRKVQGFCNSAEAIERMQAVQPDVIFTDILMPGFDGNKLAKIVRSIPHLSSVPIIAITADHNMETSRSIINNGADSVLVKPVAREILVQRTVEAIDNGSRHASRLNSEPGVDFFDRARRNQPSLSDLFMRKESAQDLRRRRKNRFRE